ncbi:hypothetical protein [Stenotrophomonas sp. B1-1]|uniref:hypothetical protein n=1 Tax=Stenotrophomonas sp. B1-1 TaxID=2710648 RepID=UPI0013DBD180|nr:hypothetical protein [Stenotrophomonas sp. B1-1]
MRLTPRNPTPPHLRQFPAICWNGILLWWVSTLVDTDEFVRYLKDVSTKVDTYQQPRGTIGADTNRRVNLSKAGRCRIAGCQPHGCGCQAYKDVLAASPQFDTAPPSHGMPLLLLLLLLLSPLPLH